MERINKFRAGIILLLFALIVSFFSFKLYDLQIIQTDGDTYNETVFTSCTRVKAARGDILDRNGNVLVSNRASYDLVINDQVLMSADGTSEYLYNLVKTCESLGIEYQDTFPITKERPFTYTLDQQSSARQSYFQSYLAFKGGLDSDITAPLLVEKLRDRYELPAHWSDDDARKVIGLYYELQLRRCVNLPNYIFITDASDEALAAVVELNIPGMNVEASTVREYNTKYAAHILGFVGPMNASQWEKYKDIEGYEMDSEIGQDGLEAAYEQYLHGIDGIREDTVTRDGTLVKSVYLQEPKAGANVEISIDINLQMVAEDSLARTIEERRAQEEGMDGQDAEGGAVVAIDVKTGQVLVCGNYPTYDLSRYSEDFNITSKDPLKPLYNRALLGTYPPGSTYKMSMVIAGIDSHSIDSKTEYYDVGYFDEYEGLTVFCDVYNYGYTHGTVNAVGALRDSCNYFFYKVGDITSIEAIDKTAKGLGLGEKTGVELPEYIGHRANPETKKELYTGDHRGWFAGDQILAAIGQSENRFTPMQLCVYTSTLANRGQRYKATFMSRVVSADYRDRLAYNEPSLVSTLEISDEAYGAVLEGMYLVASDPKGTAYKTFQDYPIEVCAKTGTAQTGIPETSSNGAFVCFAPKDDPQIAIAVYVEKGGHGSAMAIVARDILDQYFSVGDIGYVPIYENQLS